MRLPRIAATLLFAGTLSAGLAASRTAANQAGSAPSASRPSAHKKKHHSKRQPTQKAPTADRVSEIQSALARQGYYEGDPSGRMDTRTVAAMQKFQSANGLDATGKLDAPTLQKLGLGSGIAGVSAPKPAAPPSCCSMMTPASAAGAQPSATASASTPASGAAVAANSSAPAGSPKPAEH